MSDIQTKATQKEYDTTDRKHRGLSILASIILALSVGLCLILSVQVATNGYVSILGYSCFRVITGSMEPTIPVGAVLVSERVNINAIRENDIICYRTESAEIKGAIVTHRVVQLGYDSNGEYALIAQGDANLSADPYLVHADNLIGRVIWFSGNNNAFTELLRALSEKALFLAVVVVPILVIAGTVMQGCVRRLYRDIQDLHTALKADQRRNALLPGYATITQGEYDEMYERIKAEILDALSQQGRPPIEQDRLPKEAEEQLETKTPER